jgi:hypothetical protein
LTTSTTLHVRVLRHIAWLVVDYFAYAACLGDSAHHAARRRLLLPCRASRCFGTSRGSSSTTSLTPHVRVPRLVTRHIARLVVDYFASRRLVVDYFAYAARPGPSARRAARHAARRRLLRLRRASGCLGTSCGSSRDSLLRSSSTISPCAGSSFTTSPTPRARVPRHVARLVADYLADAVHPGASARRAACRVARRRLLHLRRAEGPIR